ncbi:MAG: hypothetical protein U5N55_10435 [Cypionkella sp.]|nr:hypothetical protein [Cypionkella sp.]
MFEATGLESPLRRALAEAGVTAYRVNPARACRALRAVRGGWRKTDRVDAAVLREMGRRLDPSIWRPSLKILCGNQAVAGAPPSVGARSHAREVVRAGQAEGAYARASIARVLAPLDAETTAVESEIAAKIKASPWARGG